MKPEHLVWCEACRHYTIVHAFPSEVCGRECKGCKNGLHCNSCTRRGTKVFPQGPDGWLAGRTKVVIDKVSRNIIDGNGRPQRIFDKADLKRKLGDMSRRRSDQVGYDINYSTEWGDS